jgi:hypothetical protein
VTIDSGDTFIFWSVFHHVQIRVFISLSQMPPGLSGDHGSGDFTEERKKALRKKSVIQIGKEIPGWHKSL